MERGYKNAHAALKLWGEANEKGDEKIKALAYGNFIRAKRLIDIEEYDKEMYDDFGNLVKKAGQSHNFPDMDKAWMHELPEDQSSF